MNIEVWLAFTFASLVLLLVPGPVVMLVMGYTISNGRSLAAAAIPGVILGDFVAMTISLLGAGAILQASATLFLTLKFAGAVYLVWLGIKVWKGGAGSTFKESPNRPPTRIRIMRDAFLVTALNPKDVLFFVAFLPQFITPNQPLLPQIITLEATFLVIVFFTTSAWVALADTLARQLKSPETSKFVSRFGASWLIGAGIVTAAPA
ncbi:threonine/homoserine/homoserine lactone efflux protein [Labrenzia sp. EL_195]|nr:threonine/homoserine/homoserine lactone efflux protein [Labrenzia sp. EL_195]